MEGEISLKQAVEEYRDIYLAYRNFAQRTREEYVNDLEDLVRFLGGMGIHTIEKARLSHLVRYMAELDRRGYAGSTRKRKVISIKSFFGFMKMEGHTITDVSKPLIPPFVETRKPRILTKEECDQLLICSKSNKRDYAIIQLLLNTGIKLSELTKLTINDLKTTNEFDNRRDKIEYIRVAGNHRNKDRVIPLNPVSGEAINGYLTSRTKSSVSKIFLNRLGEELGKRGVEKVVGKYLKATGIDNASVQSLRYTFGINQAIRGIKLKTIRTMMGYRDSRTTRLFLPGV